ncbi:hypothetical protein HPB51_028367 [Rhipicephalus microplus]|uniref:Uncharacterized protein n=1 Tax=Rhipicephalus microplus TaxID=6941 RepID=A0A9J6CXZ3_RHIMP|nr:hypothetical protein HPB51_028367 [Rhipicephalus microplus]
MMSLSTERHGCTASDSIIDILSARRQASRHHSSFTLCYAQPNQLHRSIVGQMTGEVTGEPVIFARSSSSDCVALCASRLSQKCARATAARAQHGDKIVPSRPSGNDDASSIGGCSESSSRIDESPKPAQRPASGHLQGSAETSVRSLEDDSSVTTVDDSSSVVVPVTQLGDHSRNPADQTSKTGAHYRRNSCSSGEDPLSEESVDGAELTEARPANETLSSTDVLGTVF